MRHVIKIVAAVMDYALWLPSNRVYKPAMDIVIGNDNEIFSHIEERKLTLVQINRK